MAGLTSTSTAGGVRLEMSKDFMAWKIDRGAFLLYLAHNAIAIIGKRTDQGVDVDGRKFKPYAEHTQLVMSDDGEIVRDEHGRWIERTARRASDLVTLRSLQDAPEKSRMRASLQAYPRNVSMSARRVTVRALGGRQNASGKRVSHHLRAKYTAGQMTIRSRTGKDVRPPRRSWIGLTPYEWRKLLRDIDHGGALAWMRKRRTEISDVVVRKAARQQQRARRARERAAKRAGQSAAQKHRAILQRNRRLGLKPGESARDAYKRTRKEQRYKRRLKREKKRNPSLRTR